MTLATSSEAVAEAVQNNHPRQPSFGGVLLDLSVLLPFLPWGSMAPPRPVRELASRPSGNNETRATFHSRQNAPERSTVWEKPHTPDNLRRAVSVSRAL